MLVGKFRLLPLRCRLTPVGLLAEKMTNRSPKGRLRNCSAALQATRDSYDAITTKCVRDHIIISSASRQRTIDVSGIEVATAHDAARKAITGMMTILSCNASPRWSTMREYFNSVLESVKHYNVDVERIEAEIHIEFGLAVKHLTSPSVSTGILITKAANVMNVDADTLRKALKKLKVATRQSTNPGIRGNAHEVNTGDMITASGRSRIGQSR